MRLPLAPVALLSVLALNACGGPEREPEAVSPASPVSSSTGADPTVAAEAVSEILGEESGFQSAGGGAGPLEADIDGRECVFTDALNGSCRGAAGAGGDFVLTAEGSVASPGEWNVVVRCGLLPAVPSASAQGSFTPVIADLGLAPYGDVIGVHLLGGDVTEASLIYQPEGATCPVVWGLGEVDSASLFTGGIDALNGSESPIAFRNAEGADACAVSDGQGGIRVGTPRGGDCS